MNVAASAVADYRRYQQTLRKKADANEKAHRPLNARIMRELANRVGRAVLAEMTDPEPVPAPCTGRDPDGICCPERSRA
jgi:hypothetical protein